MKSIWDRGDEFERADRDLQNYLYEKKVEQRLREPLPSGLPHNEKHCTTKDNGGFQYYLPDDCKQVIAVSYPKDEITSLMLNEEDYEVNGNKLLITNQRPQPGEQIQITYRR